MGMNAKRSRDRFFKPDLESSSLSIPALDCAASGRAAALAVTGEIARAEHSMEAGDSGG